MIFSLIFYYLTNEFYLFLYFYEILPKKMTPNKVELNEIVVNAIKYTWLEKKPRKKVDVIPAINWDEDNKNVNIALYLPLFYLPLHIYLRYPPWLTHKNPADIPPTSPPKLTRK